MIQDFAP